MRFIALAASAALAAGLCGAAASAYYVRSHLPNSHIQSRSKAILSQADQESFPIIVLGDSIVELADIPQLCGQRTLNAGLAGGTLEQVSELGEKLLANNHPKFVLIAVGVNDANAKYPTNTQEFARTYKSLVGAVQRSGAIVVATNIEPVGSSAHPDTALFDRAHISRLNQVIAHLGVPMVPLAQAMDPKSTSILADSDTNDGVHPNATGYVRWRRAVSGACTYYPAQLPAPSLDAA
jgi:lysophospholipase L1-like esterase